MLGRRLWQASPWPRGPFCQLHSRRNLLQPFQCRPFIATSATLDPTIKSLSGKKGSLVRRCLSNQASETKKTLKADPNTKSRRTRKRRVSQSKQQDGEALRPSPLLADEVSPREVQDNGGHVDGVGAQDAPKSLKDALLGGKPKRKRKTKQGEQENLPISMLYPEDLKFEPVDVNIPPVPMLSYGLDRVLFNPGIYRLQDPRSLVYNFDPYLEKIMPVNEFDFDALSEYKTSSKDEELLALTKRLGSKFTGSTSSMSGVLQHFHFLLSSFRKLNQTILSREFPDPSVRFSKITLGPSAVFLRYKDGLYAIDADKSFDSPNIMSWLGHSLEKLLTTERSEFERYRKSSPEHAPTEDNSSRCYHYSKQGNLLMRSQLDAIDPRLPGTGVFDLKTRAVVSIRMNHKEYVEGAGYQLRKSRGEWESFEREFYDMTRATLLKYSLQVRMGRMDGIFIAFHNIERIFGFQYLNIADMDTVLHGQSDTCLGDQEFKLSIALLDELLGRATVQFPETVSYLPNPNLLYVYNKKSIRLHVETREGKTPFMYVFAEPVTEAQADQIQTTGEVAQKDFARTVVGVGKDNPEVQAAWHSIKDGVDEQVDEDKNELPLTEDQNDEIVVRQTEAADSTGDILTSADPPTNISDNLVEAAGEVSDEESNEDRSVDSILDEDTINQESETSDENLPSPEAVSDGPLMGWTLTVRNKVNGEYVDRPENLTERDNWKIEYYIQDVPEEARWKLYQQIQKRRRNLIGQDDEAVDKGLKHYRNYIQQFSARGRRWREEQDRLNEAKGVELYRPLGPGSGTDVTRELTTENVQNDGSGGTAQNQSDQDKNITPDPQHRISGFIL